MTESIVLEQVMDLLDNQNPYGELVTEANVVEKVAELVSKVETLTEKNERLLEDLEDMSENL